MITFCTSITIIKVPNYHHYNVVYVLLFCLTSHAKIILYYKFEPQASQLRTFAQALIVLQLIMSTN